MRSVVKSAFASLLFGHLFLLSGCSDGAMKPPSSLDWKWEFRSLGGEDEPIVAGGTLVTSAMPDEQGAFVVQQIIGQRNGVPIESVYPAGEAIPGNTDPTTGAPYAGNNLLLKPGQNGVPQLDANGMQFSLTDDTYSNVFYASYLDPPSYLEMHTKPPFPAGPTRPNTELPVVFEAEPLE